MRDLARRSRHGEPVRQRRAHAHSTGTQAVGGGGRQIRPNALERGGMVDA